MQKLFLIIILVNIFFASISLAGDKEILELKQTQMQVIEARKGQIQAQSMLLQISFKELERQEAILKDEIKALEEKINGSEGKKKK